MRADLSIRRLQPLAKAVTGDFSTYDLLTYSSAMAFQALYAVIPTALLGLAVLGIFGDQSLYTNHIAHTLQRALSPDAFSLTDRTARKALGPERYWWATIGLGVTLWGVGAALRSMMTPLNAIYGTRETRSWLRRLLASIGGGAIVVVCVYAAILVIVGGRLVHAAGALAMLLFVVRWLVALAALLVAVATLIRVVPAKQRPFRWISVGSLLSAVCWVVTTIGFGAYISTVSYSSFYGAFATIILLLVYLHLSAIAFLLGVTVDAELRARATR